MGVEPIRTGGALQLAGKRRLFVGVRVPEHVREELEGAQDAIEAFYDGKATSGEGLHVTLKFLGEVDARGVERVQQRLRRARLPESTARILGFGSFSNRIAWARVGGLEEAQRRVDEALRGLFEPEKRFMGHLTIARMKRVANPAALRAALSAILPRASWRVHEIELIESRLGRSGARYSVIASYPCSSRKEETVLEHA